MPPPSSRCVCFQQVRYNAAPIPGASYIDTVYQSEDIFCGTYTLLTD